MNNVFRRLLRLACALALLVPLVCRAAAPDPAVARGKKVLLVFNSTKLERTRAAQPADPVRLGKLEAQRASDLKLAAFLESLGFTVTRADETSPLSAAEDKDLVVISETVDALDIAAKYRHLAVPLIDCENDLLGDLGMTGQKSSRDYGTEEEQRFVWIVNSPHPLAAGLAAGVQNVLTDEHCKMNWGKPGLGAVTIATLRGEPDKAAIFAYEKGATMNWEFLAPARRVSFFLWSDTFTQLRPEGLALFRAAVLWAATKPD